MIVTVDGPAGAGKSTLARQLAEQLGFAFLDTGAMYRAVTWQALQKGTAWDDPHQLADLARNCELQVDGPRILLDGKDVSDRIRTVEVTTHVHYLADNPDVRAVLVEAQREAARGRDIVCEGRDQGTVVFPAAECKIFLTASPAERARRRMLEMQQRGEDISLDEVLAQQNERDRRDATRPVGRLEQADDAIEVMTDGLTQEQALARLVEIVRQHLPHANDG